MKRILFFILIAVIYSSSVSSQTFKKWGIKGGAAFSGISTMDSEHNFTEDNSAIVNLLNLDFGLYAEWLNTEKFCVATELHYNVIGERNPNHYKVLNYIPNINGNIYEVKYLSDRYHYLSFQILPRYRFVLTPSNENLYIMAGPSFDLLLNNYNSDDTESNVYELKNGKFDFSMVFGAGVEFKDKLVVEFKIDRSLTGPYEFYFGDGKVSRRFNSINLLIGFVLKNYKRYNNY